MTLQELNTRIEKKKNDIEKRKKLIEKAEAKKAKLIDKWEIETAESDLKYSKYKLNDLECTLTNLLKQKEKEEIKQAVEKIPAIEELLNQWAESAREHIKQVEADYKQIRTELNNYIKKFNGMYHLYRNDEKYIELNNKFNTFNQLNAGWLNIPDIDKFIKNQIDARRQNLMAQCEKHIGTITDATRLYFGYNDGINGIITGTKGKASVTTIYAGGYNIQCLHYRVLVKPIK